jgi:hypothetical protein
VRADDDLQYVAKDEAGGVPSVRASEFFWLSVARMITLPAAAPEIIEDATGRKLVATRREFSAVGKDQATTQPLLLSGNVMNGGRQLSRIYAFDLFSGNWDRHPGNYLVLDNAGTLAVFAIDFSHVVLVPDLASRDPATMAACATRQFFAPIVASYGADQAAAIEAVDRLAALPNEGIRTILTSIPDVWLEPIAKSAVLAWWAGAARVARADLIRQGLQNGSYI